MPKRRTLFQLAAGMPLAAARKSPPSPYAALGLRPVINFQGPVTTVGASKMLPEIQAVMAEAARDFAVLEEVKDAVGLRIAKLCGTEAAVVTTGCAGAIALGTYACVAGSDSAKIRRLPDITGMKSEVVIQKVHRNGYDHAVRSAGVRIVEVETPEQFANALTAKTAMIYFLGGQRGDWKIETPISLESMLPVAKKAGVPVLIDAANMLPPWGSVPKLAATGIDLIAFSGGKHIRGPQSSGVLAGRKNLIDAAWLNSSPHSDSNGRSMKVNKEEMIGLLHAIERYATIDFAAMDRECEKQAAYLMTACEKIGLQTAKAPFDRTRRVHRVLVSWNEAKRGRSGAQVVKELMDGEPRIAVLRNPNGQGLEFTFMMNDAGDEKLAARRLREIFG
ncbi:MAG: aminotransferase class V-fold PLP-dependent enzyme [Acidobacteria bacterium]|nr:aminotransferase class V-fold PLP-dependent enzyme [Acidobacteriota bacterium]